MKDWLWFVFSLLLIAFAFGLIRVRCTHIDDGKDDIHIIIRSE